MKIKSSVFLRALETNFYQISGDIIKIHSFTKSGCGIIRKIKNQYGKPTDGAEFILKKNDADILARFNGDLTLIKDGETIKCTYQKSTCKIQNISDMVQPKLQMADLKPVAVDMNYFRKAAGLITKEGVQITSGGIAVTDEAHSMVYRAIEEYEVPQPVNIPAEFLKYLDKTMSYELRTNGKIAVLMNASEIVYTTVYEKLAQDLSNFFPEARGYFELLGDEELKTHIQYAAMFGTLIRLAIVKKDGLKMLHVSSEWLGGSERKYEADLAVVTNIEEFSECYDAKTLLKCIGCFNFGIEKPLQIGVNDTLLRINADNELFVAVRTKTFDDVELRLIGEMEADSNDGSTGTDPESGE